MPYSKQLRYLILFLALVLLCAGMGCISLFYSQSRDQYSSTYSPGSDITISVRTNPSAHNELSLYVENASQYHFQIGIPAVTDIYLGAHNSWEPISSEGVSPLLAVVVSPGATYHESIETSSPLNSGTYRISLFGMKRMDSNGRTLEAFPDSFLEVTIEK